VKNMRRDLRSLAALAVVVLAGAGCGEGAAGTGDAGARTASGTGTASKGGKARSDQAQGVKFAECVRRNGVSDFPDPDASGEFRYGVSVTPEVWNTAIGACKELQPPGSLSADRTPEEQDAGLRFARCIRENGVEDFPDPANGEPLVNTYKIPSSNEPGGMDILNAAMHACREFTRDAIGSQP